MVNSTINWSSLANSPDKTSSNLASKTLASIYRAKVVEAYKNRRIFTVFGNNGTIRNSLLKRGWLEKLPQGRYNKLRNLPEETLLSQARKGNEYETVAISKIINHFPAFFVWQSKDQRDLYMDVNPYRNRLRIGYGMDFSTKIGLIACAEQEHWYRQDGVASMSYPRFYRLGDNQEDRLAFIDDYRLTSCCSLLRFLRQHFNKHEEIADYQNGTISPAIVHFAITRVKQQLEDLEKFSFLEIEQSYIPEDEWSNFLDNSYKLINNHQKIRCTYRELSVFVTTAKKLLIKMEEKYPKLRWDGYKNLWILKPGYLNRGRGIVVQNNLNEILKWCSSFLNRHYVVQKYIEQPLLIYRTKFDIRQYMLICVREATVQIWLYTDCYFRFSSQEFTTDDFSESVHLTNNCIQKKYKNNVNRDLRLPTNNMWSLSQFKAYLKTQKKPDDFWERRIFAGFKENIIAAVLPSLDEVNFIPNAFELFGCDFMLDEEFYPILIEINSTPDMIASTNVTARICPMALQDCLKVVVDLPQNNRASTGLFKMIYEVNYKINHNTNDLQVLNIIGTSKELCKPIQHAERPKLMKKTKTQKKPQAKNIPKKKVNAPVLKKAAAKTSTNSKSSVLTSASKALKSATKEALR